MINKTDQPEYQATRIIQALYCSKPIECKNCAHFIWNCTGKPQYKEPKEEQ